MGQGAVLCVQTLVRLMFIEKFFIIIYILGKVESVSIKGFEQ